MSILVNRDTRVVVQGITGREGAFHTEQMIEYGTKVVAGMTPGKGGTKVEGVPVFNTITEARAAAGQPKRSNVGGFTTGWKWGYGHPDEF